MKKYITLEKYFKSQSIIKKNNKLKIFIYIIVILLLLIIMFSLYTIFKWHIDNLKIKKINKEIKDNINIKTNNKNSNYYYYINYPFYNIDFSNLLSKNKDTVAFIRVINTIINYPVVKTINNNYYLKHSFDKKENDAGWIYMDYRNNINDLDDNTIIYGHRRLDGTMFGTLKNVLSSTWQNNIDNYIIYFSTLNENMIFQIFSIYTIKRENYYITTTFSNDNEKQKWIYTMKKRNISPINTEVNTNDKFLTLSTCYGNSTKRLVIHAKLIKKQKNK